MCLAIPGQIIEVTNHDVLMRSGLVRFGGITRPINLALVPDAKVGDYILAHVGIAISMIAEEEAQRVFDYLEQLGDLDLGDDDAEARR